MIDLTTPDGRIVSAALGLAGERKWAEVTLADIAERAGCSLVELKAHFATKGAILSAFTARVDDEVLRRAPRRDAGQARRDALFEVIMSRFDVLDPYKGALRSIVASGLPEPGQIPAVLASQRWMLEAAGIGAGGLDGGLRTVGLASLYASVCRIWLEDDDAGLARTMAALDRRLRRAERTVERLDGLCQGVGRVCGAVMGALRGRRDGTRPPADPMPPAPGTPHP